MNSFCPTSGSEAEWKEARARLEAYLRALHLANEEQQERIISVVLQQAAVKHAQNPVESPTALAMNEIRDISEQWFAKLSESGERKCTMGFVLLFATDATKKWPAAFTWRRNSGRLSACLKGVMGAGGSRFEVLQHGPATV